MSQLINFKEDELICKLPEQFMRHPSLYRGGFEYVTDIDGARSLGKESKLKLIIKNLK
jgi:hypothetical protein